MISSIIPRVDQAIDKSAAKKNRLMRRISGTDLFYIWQGRSHIHSFSQLSVFKAQVLFSARAECSMTIGIERNETTGRLSVCVYIGGHVHITHIR